MNVLPQELFKKIPVCDLFVDVAVVVANIPRFSFFKKAGDSHHEGWYV